MGERKVYQKIKKDLSQAQIKIGRDQLFSILKANKMLIRKSVRHIHTTNSRHWYKKHPNLIREMVPESPNQLWVSDITYLQKERGFMYLSLITDAYSRKIVGYYIGDTLEASNTIKALRMALENTPNLMGGLIHHSDRGMQYCCYAYVKLLQDHNIKISMTEKGDPLENAIAERVNGILKQEYLDYKEVYDNQKLKEVIDYYNNERPHMSCNMLTPNDAHQKTGKLNRTWKNYYKNNNLVKQYQD